MIFIGQSYAIKMFPKLTVSHQELSDFGVLVLDYSARTVSDTVRKKRVSMFLTYLKKKVGRRYKTIKYILPYVHQI